MNNNYQNRKIKVGIVTITEGTNYGNRLQNYATQTILEELGLSAETIYHDSNENMSNITFSKKILKKLITLKKQGIQHIVYKFKNIDLYKIFHKNELYAIEENRRKRFNEFNRKYIRYSSFKTTIKDIPLELCENYDYFLCGSDQIWNPYYTASVNTYFLTFSSYEKNIAYAPSLGVTEFPPNMKKLYSNWISNIKYLSVREKAGANIIKRITDREVEVLIDPTLMLDKNQWLKIAETPKIKPTGKYILNYFLGNKEYVAEKKIKHIAKTYSMEIYNLQDHKNNDKYSINPSEFIDLIKGASLVCTDSFHGSVFAILMKVPFIVFERNSNGISMSSRLDNLLSLLELKSRYEKNIIGEENILKVDYSHVDNILKIERDKAKVFLCNAFSKKK